MLSVDMSLWSERRSSLAVRVIGLRGLSLSAVSAKVSMVSGKSLACCQCIRLYVRGLSLADRCLAQEAQCIARLPRAIMQATLTGQIPGCK